MTGKVIFRVNAGRKYGLGHLLRNFALRDELILKGISYYFIIKTDDSSLVRKFLQKKEKETCFHLFNHEIDKNQEITNLLSGYNLNNDILVVDHYDHDKEYFNILKSNKVIWAQYDFKLTEKIIANLVINPNIGVNDKNYSNLVQEDTKLCIGNRFVIIRNEIKKVISEKLVSKNILISMGGGDYPDDVVEMIKTLLENVEYKFNIISNSDKLNEVLASYENLSLFHNPENIAGIYKRSKFAIVAGGVTANELAYLGIPMLMVPFAENQIANTINYEKSNYSLSFRNPNHFVSTLKEKGLNKCLDLLKSLFQNRDKNLIDGNGAERIVNEILSLRAL